MGAPDQLAKRIFQTETLAVTGRHVAFEVPAEVPVGALQPDGVVRVVLAPGLAELSVPWSRLRVDATIDVKMPGDHTDRATLARCELRRHARWVQRLEALRQPETSPSLATAAAPDPRDFASWVLSPRAPGWLREDAAKGVFELELIAPGCWRIGLGVHETLWIAANELPLREEFLPLLIARSGRPLIEFLAWSAGLRGPAWTRKVIQEMRMSADTANDSLSFPDDEEEQRKLKTELTRRLLDAYPEAANEIRDRALVDGIEKGAAQTLARQFERRLARTLTDAERDTLLRRVHALGPARLGDLVLDLTPVELDGWLRDPHAV